jgi:hypothetical protein
MEYCLSMGLHRYELKNTNISGEKKKRDVTEISFKEAIISLTSRQIAEKSRTTQPLL